MSCIIIAGASGQDGSYLAEQALSAGYRVIGLLRDGNSSALVDGVERIEWNFTDEATLRDVLRCTRPLQFYNLAAMSSGAGMHEDPVAMGEINGIVPARILKAILEIDPQIRFCQASSSEMFGEASQSPQTESTAFRPLSPYGAAKLYAHTAVRTYRDRYGLFACSAILFNHESPRRRPGFVTRKIVDAVARIVSGSSERLLLGDLDAHRDWGYAPDFVRAMQLMLAHDSADDYVVATGELHSVRQFCELAFAHVGLDWRDWVEGGVTDAGRDSRGPHVGDASKLRDNLGWRPEIDFCTLVGLMVDAAMESLKMPVST